MQSMRGCEVNDITEQIDSRAYGDNNCCSNQITFIAEHASDQINSWWTLPPVAAAFKLVAGFH